MLDASEEKRLRRQGISTTSMPCVCRCPYEEAAPYENIIGMALRVAKLSSQ